MVGINAAAIVWNNKPAVEKSSKYVSGVQIDPAAGFITVVIKANMGNGLPLGLDGKTLVFSPNVQQQAPTDTVQGTMDWACASADHTTATDRGFGNIQPGTLLAKYAPPECK